MFFCSHDVIVPKPAPRLTCLKPSATEALAQARDLSETSGEPTR
jgi:hypothetical protein